MLLEEKTSERHGIPGYMATHFLPSKFFCLEADKSFLDVTFFSTWNTNYGGVVAFTNIRYKLCPLRKSNFWNSPPSTSTLIFVMWDLLSNQIW